MSYKWNHTGCTFKGWILSFSVLLRFIHVVAFNDRTHKKSMSARSHGLSGATGRVSTVYSDALTVPAAIELRV